MKQYHKKQALRGAECITCFFTGEEVRGAECEYCKPVKLTDRQRITRIVSIINHIKPSRYLDVFNLLYIVIEGYSRSILRKQIPVLVAKKYMATGEVVVRFEWLRKKEKNT